MLLSQNFLKQFSKDSLLKDPLSKESIRTFLLSLRNEIILSFETFETAHHFQRKKWSHAAGGGGEMAVLRGDVFEKAAVNFSEVYGEEYPLDKTQGPYYATGISLITHMKNPHAPTSHMNLRYIQLQDRAWLGGGYDLTPMGFYYEEDERHLHETARNALQPYPGLYETFSQNAKEYFYIPHRKKERGIGGLFFDYYATSDLSHDFSMWQSVGDSFLKVVAPIYQKRVSTSYSEADREKQFQFRGHYVEFNLLYDRGTKFGFQSGGNSEAILCSLPPLASW